MKIEKLLTNLSIKDKSIDFKKLKKLMENLETETQKEIFESELETEFTQFSEFVEIKYCEAEEQMKNKHNVAEDEILKDEISKFCEFVLVNILAVKKIIHKFDKVTGKNLKKNYKENLKILTDKIELLKSIIISIDQQEGRDEIFENLAGTFWISADNLVNLKLNIIQRLDKVTYVNNARRLYDSIVSTVYLDNVDFSLYNSYFENQKESFFIRLRWYGDSATIVYCEFVYLDSEYNDQNQISIKIPERLVLEFLNGNDIWEYLKGLNNKRSEYDMVRERIVDMKLRPMVRTFFKRTIFENSFNPDLKVFLDTNIVFIKECSNSDLYSDGFPLKSWTRQDIGYDWPFKYAQSSEITRFPFAILQISKSKDLEVSSEDVTWLKSILSTSLVEKIPDFSQFIHGCSLLFPISGRVPESIVHIDRMKLESKNITDALVHIKGESEISYDFSQVTDEENEPKITVRVEPKAFFANERTFLNWIEFAVYVGGSGTALVSLGNIHAYMFGVLLIACTVVFSVYVLYLYHYRAINIRLRHTVPYDDYVGASLLISIFMIIIIVSFILKYPIKKNGI